MKNLNKEMKLIIIIGSTLIFSFIFYVIKKISSSDNKEIKVMQENVFGVSKNDSIMSFKDLMNNEDGYLGNEKEKTVNPFAKSKDDRYFDALTGKGNIKPREVKSEQEIIDSILASNKRIEQNNQKKISRNRGSNINFQSHKKNKTSKTKETNNSNWKENLEKDANDFFYSPSANTTQEEKSTTELKTDSKIFAVISGEQRVKNKSRVRMRLAKDCYVNGVLHKRNSIVYGFVTFAKHRVFVNVKDINNERVNLSVYDAEDYDKGLHTEIDFSSEVTKEVKNDAIDEVDVSKVPLGNTIKSLVKRKNKVDDVVFSNNTKLTFKHN